MNTQWGSESESNGVKWTCVHEWSYKSGGVAVHSTGEVGPEGGEPKWRVIWHSNKPAQGFQVSRWMAKANAFALGASLLQVKV